MIEIYFLFFIFSFYFFPFLEFLFPFFLFPDLLLIRSHPITPIQVENLFDLGYMGVQNDFPTVKSVLPFRKKRKKGELSDEEKKHNRRHSKLRVIVEHTEAELKNLG